MNESKISTELSSIITDKIKKKSDEQVPVIVNLKEVASLKDSMNKCTKAGLKIGNIIEGPVLVIAGSISAKDIYELAKCPGVEKIDYDGKVYAQ
jgi:hypothetical protein